MRRGYGWGAAILAVLLLVGVGIGAYNLGVGEGLERAAGDGIEVVRHVGGPGFGFFPFFPFLFFPLLFLLIFAFKGAWWGRRWGNDHDHPHGPGGHGGHGAWERGFEDWHRRQHEGGAGAADAGAEPSGPSA